MAAFRSLLLLSLVYSVIGNEANFFDPCYKDDINCLSAATEAFLEKTHNGVDGSQIKAIDPFIIPELEVLVDEEMGLLFKFTNLSVTGLKKLQILDYKMDTDKKSVVLKTKADLNIIADLNIKFTKKNNKSFDGLYKATTTASGTSNYGYSLVKKGDNEIYFEVGPETNTCEIIEEPTVTVGDELQAALLNDNDARQLKSPYEENKVNLRKKTLCKIVDSAYVVVINNLRTLATTLPAKRFFLGLY
ncbi:juvenile hormone-binding protein-like [Trichoplusia ni]|uniref:Juvenile hormone-binding protein-like n=1 Tax=Trichoplusia ni TaxID=7111 RepID=A0A7E5W0N5_TRINI|nr:juvenile hormone-binding protein-like [Trichoplusia ni]